MSELLFLVEVAAEGGYTAHVFSADIISEADDLIALHANVRDAVKCHFDDGQAPKMIRLHEVGTSTDTTVILTRSN